MYYMYICTELHQSAEALSTVRLICSQNHAYGEL